MEMREIKHSDLNQFLESRKMQMLHLARMQTEQIVQKETEMMDFELLLSVNMPKEEQNALADMSRKLRTDSWQGLFTRFNGNLSAMNTFLETI